MLSSLTAYNASYGADVLKLFLTSGSDAATPGPAAPATPSAAAPGPDPAAAIKNILAKAQMSAGASAPGGGSSYALVSRAYGGLEGGSEAVADNGAGSLAVAAAGHTPFSQWQGGVWGTAGAKAEQMSATAAPAGPSGVTLQFADALAVTTAEGSQALSVGVGVTVAGLGPLTATDTHSFSAHALDADHAFSEVFTLETFVEGQNSQLNFHIDGLTATQAKSLDDALNAAAQAQGVAKAGPVHADNGVYYAADAVDEYVAPGAP